MTSHIGALLARATADCADPANLMEFCSSLIGHLQRLDAAARIVVAQSVTLDSNNEEWCLICASPAASHGMACPVVALAAILKEQS